MQQKYKKDSVLGKEKILGEATTSTVIVFIKFNYAEIMLQKFENQ